MRLDNKGITLVELIIAIAASTIVFGAAMIFMTSAHRGYNTAATEINLQTEAQVLVEQISEWVMEGNKIEVDAAANKLQVYRTDIVSVGYTTSKRIIWLGGDGKLYMKKFTDTSLDVSTTDEIMENCIGEYVTGFTPGYDPSNDDKVTIGLKLSIGTKDYEVNNTFKVRSAITTTGIRRLDWREAV